MTAPLDEMISSRLGGLGFDRRYWSDLSLTTEQLAVKTQCDYLLKRRGAIVAVVGIRGTGKTSIAAQIAIERIRQQLAHYCEPDAAKRLPVRCLPWYFKAAALVARFKSLHADFGSIDTDRLQEAMERTCRECGLIIIDEWHECDDQKMRDRVLVDMIDRFYAAENDVLIISNQDGKDFAAKTNASILSRLNEHGRIIPCKWQSFRSKREREATLP